MNYQKLSNAIAIVSCLGIIAWIITDFYGGMIIYFIMYSYIILATIILYFLSVIQTIFSLILKGFKRNRIRLVTHAFVLLFIGGVALYQSDVLKPKQIVNATLHDDLYHYTLILREGGDCELNTIGFMGFTDYIKGEYFMKGDTIIFKKVPYDNDFIPDTIYWNKKADAIFITRKEDGTFSNEKSFLNHFEVNE